MFKQFKFFILTYILFLFCGMFSCQDDDCPPVSSITFVADLMQVNLFEFSNNGDSRTLNEPFSDSLEYSSAVIQLKFSFKEVEKTTTTTVSGKTSFSLLQPIYACSPAFVGTTSKFLNIEITSNQDFATDYEAGRNLISFFDIIEFDGLNQFNDNRIDLMTHLNQLKEVPVTMLIVLKESPEFIEERKFNVKVDIQGTTIDTFELETKSIVVF